MKSLAPLCFLLLLTFGSSIITPALINMTEFMSGIYSYYELSLPANFMLCFQEQDAFNFMLAVEYFFIVSQTIQSGYNGYYFANDYFLNGYIASVKGPIQCASHTSDFSNLAGAVGIPSNLTNMTLVFGEYLQSYVPEFLAVSNSSFQNFESGKYYDSGYDLAQLLPILYNNGSQNATYGQVRGWYNGMFTGLNMSAPQDSVACYNASVAPNLYTFYFNFTQNISNLANNTTPQSTWDNTNLFLTTSGQTIWNQIPSNVTKCFYDSSDDFRTQKYLQFDPFNPYDTNFQQGLKQFILENTTLYLGWMQNVSYFLKNRTGYPIDNLMLAGIYYGYVLNATSLAYRNITEIEI